MEMIKIHQMARGKRQLRECNQPFKDFKETFLASPYLRTFLKLLKKGKFLLLLKSWNKSSFSRLGLFQPGQFFL